MALAQSIGPGIPAHATLRPGENTLVVKLLLPALLLEALFVVLPLLIGVHYSLHDVRYFNLGDFTGLENYRQVLTSPLVLQSIVVTIVFTLVSLVLIFGVGLALALHLEQDSRSNIAVRAVVLIPYVVSMMVGSLLLKWIFSQDSGVLQSLLAPFGIGEVSVFADARTAMAALVFNAMWRDSAFAMVLLLAGLKSIPPDLHLAAKVDGASAWFRFRRITLPLLRLPIVITVVRLVMHLANSLTYPLILTGGGPLNATETTTLRIFRLGFEDYDLGQANALTFVAFLLNLVLLAILLRLFRQNQRLA
jgi:multiple sugar transport system permease protein